MTQKPFDCVNDVIPIEEIYGLKSGFQMLAYLKPEANPTCDTVILYDGDNYQCYVENDGLQKETELSGEFSVTTLCKY